jgi:hypothetical protein
MKHIIMMLTLAVLLVAALTVTAAGAFADAKLCEQPADPGCKEERTPKKEAGASLGFIEEEEQRGNVNAKGTENTETTVCYGPSGKELCPDHPQCS